MGLQMSKFCTLTTESFLISTLIPSLKRIGSEMLKIESGNYRVLPDINSYTKFEENWFRNAQDRERKRNR